QAGGPIFLCAANAGLLRGLIAANFEFSQELVEEIRLRWREQFGPARLRPNLGYGVQARVVRRPVGARGAGGPIMRGPAASSRGVDGEGVGRGADTLSQCGVALDQGKIELAVLAQQRRAQPE